MRPDRSVNSQVASCRPRELNVRYIGVNFHKTFSPRWFRLQASALTLLRNRTESFQILPLLLRNSWYRISASAERFRPNETGSQLCENNVRPGRKLAPSRKKKKNARTGFGIPAAMCTLHTLVCSPSSKRRITPPHSPHPTSPVEIFTAAYFSRARRRYRQRGAFHTYKAPLQPRCIRDCFVA